MRKLYYFTHAGVTIEFDFLPTELVFLQENVISQFKEVWGKFLGGGRKPDFSVRLVQGDAKEKVMVMEKGRRYYFLTYLRDFRKRRVQAYYSGSIRTIDLLLKEIYAFLLEKDGFLLHASSLKTKTKIIAFLAPTGGGKTTTAKNLMGSKSDRFGDDIVLVRKINGKWRFFSPPFMEKEGVPRKQEADAGAFYLVKKAKKPYKKILTDKTRLLPSLLGQIWLGEKGVTRKILGSAASFLGDHDFYELGATLNKKEMRKLVK